MYLVLWAFRFSRELFARWVFHVLNNGLMYAFMWLVTESIPEVLAALMLRFQGFKEETYRGDKWNLRPPFRFERRRDEDSDDGGGSA